MTPDIVRLARAHALEAGTPDAEWTFTTWHESMLYAALYGGRHETYGLGGVRKSVIENRQIAGILPELGNSDFEPDFISAVSARWASESVYSAEDALISAKWVKNLDSCYEIPSNREFLACFYKTE